MDDTMTARYQGLGFHDLRRANATAFMEAGCDPDGQGGEVPADGSDQGE